MITFVDAFSAPAANMRRIDDQIAASGQQQGWTMPVLIEGHGGSPSPFRA
jgi:hypothetical protein